MCRTLLIEIALFLIIKIQFICWCESNLVLCLRVSLQFMDLRTRYTALVTLTTQHVKYISDALRRLEEEEVGLRIKSLWCRAGTICVHCQAEKGVLVFNLKCFCAERGGGGEAGQSGSGVRSAGLGQRPPGTDRGTQR